MIGTSRARYLAPVLVSVALAVGGGAIALNSVGAQTVEKSGGKIKACVAKNGDISLKKGSCRKGSKTLTWNVKGKRGKAGTRGPAGTTTITTRYVDLVVPTGTKASEKAFCEEGEVATGGGFYWYASPSASMYVQDQAPINAVGTVNGFTDDPTPVGWIVEAYNNSGSSETGIVHVMCAATTGAPTGPRIAPGSAPRNGRP